MAWPPATRDHGTFCISCHTALPYALARPALRAALGEEAPSQNERRLLESVNKRVRLWNEVKPFYTESSGARKTLQSRGTESILNALILASADARNGKLSDDTRAAFDYMWALQGKTGDQKGAWPWLDSVSYTHLGWESRTSSWRFSRIFERASSDATAR